MGIALIVLAMFLSFGAIADILRTPAEQIRGLSQSAWLLVVILIPYFGVISWLMFGKPTGLDTPSTPREGLPPLVPKTRGRVQGPDDDPAFLASLDRRLNGDDEPPQR